MALKSPATEVGIIEVISKRYIMNRLKQLCEWKFETLKHESAKNKRNMKKRIQCHICQSDKLHQFSDYETFYQVSSDCKPFDKGGTLAICH